MSLLDKASLVVTPNAYKESKLYSVVPNTTLGDMTVVRATTATRVNSAGLIEVVPRNLLTYSEQFNNASWVNNGATIIPNDTIAPDGNLTADRLTATGGGFGIVKFSTWTTTNKVASCFVKSNSSNLFRIANVSAGGGSVTFNLSTQAITATAGFIGTIEALPNGWFRCVAIDALARSGTFSIGVSAIGESVFIWGAQLEQGSTATEYFPTTTRLNIPRIDYTNGSCPSILVEPQRTNLALYSEQFDNAHWSKGNSSVTANATTSPSGVMDADKLVENTATSSHTIITPTISITGNVTLTVYVKPSGRDWIILRDAFGFGKYFNISNGTIGNNYGTAPISSSITDAGDGWYRCSITTNASGGTRPNILLSADGITEVYTGDGTSGVYIWGAQLELGTYSTSYIPTIASTVTRNADVISKTGISSLIGQTEGTIFLDINVNGISKDLFYFTTNLNANVILGILNNTFRVTIYASSAGYNFTIPTITNFRNKLAVTYKSGNSSFYLNGNLISKNTSLFTFPIGFNDIYLNRNLLYGNNTTQFNSVQLYKTVLTDTELAQLTTL